MYELIEVTDSMVKQTCYFSGRVDIWAFEYGCRYHVVELMIGPDGDWDITVVRSTDDVRTAIDEVWFRDGYRADYAPEGWTSEYEIWAVWDSRYFMYDSKNTFCEYFEVLPQWLYCVEDWDGRRLFTTSAEDWEEDVKLYGGGSVSSPTVKALKFHYHDRLGYLEYEAYFPVITVKVL